MRRGQDAHSAGQAPIRNDNVGLSDLSTLQKDLEILHTDRRQATVDDRSLVAGGLDAALLAAIDIDDAADLDAHMSDQKMSLTIAGSAVCMPSI